MFEIGDYIVYGNSGICEVAKVEEMALQGEKKGRIYYVLHPFQQRESTVYVPADSHKTVMRKVITREEAEMLLQEIPDIEELQIENERERESKYKECIRSCECREWVRVMKTLRLRGKEREEQGRKVTHTDEKYLKAAEENLFAELSLVLGMPVSDVEKEIVFGETEKI